MVKVPNEKLKTNYNNNDNENSYYYYTTDLKRCCTKDLKQCFTKEKNGSFNILIYLIVHHGLQLYYLHIEEKCEDEDFQILSKLIKLTDYTNFIIELNNLIKFEKIELYNKQKHNDITNKYFFYY